MEANELDIDVTEVFEQNYDVIYNDKKYLVNVGGSRCHSKDTLIRMYDGTLKPVQDIVIGDKVMHPNGIDYNTVIDTHTGVDQMYKVKHSRSGFEDYEVNGDHILALKQTVRRKYTGTEWARYKKTGEKPDFTFDKDKWHFMSVKEYMNLSKNKQKLYSEVLQSYNEYQHIDIDVDPYYFGLFLGDGISSRPYSITNVEPEIKDWLIKYGKSINHIVKYKDLVYSFHQDDGKQCELSKKMYNYNQKNNKHIPKDYLYNSKENRLKLLAGIIDSDGYNSGRNTLGICMTRKELMEDIHELVLSLGFYCTFGEYNANMKREDGSIYTTPSYRLEINANNFDELNKYILVPRKRIIKDNKNNIYTNKIKIEPTQIKDYYGFELDGDHLYKLKSGIVQHNSSKTYSLCQLLIIYCLTNSDKVVSIVRKSFPALRATVMRDFFSILKDLDLYDKKRHNKTEHIYEFSNGTYVEFFSVDDEQKVRGRKRDILWANEANELFYDDFVQLNLRTSTKMIFDYNPSESSSWLYELDPRETDTIHSTFKNNPFLSKGQVKTIEQYEFTDPDMWAIYGLGEKTTSKLNVYSHFKRGTKPAYLNKFVYGLDFGYNHPTALVKVWYGDHNEIFIEELIYESYLTTPELIRKMDELNINKRVEIMADFARPEIIAEINQNGYTCLNADKSVKKGIDDVKSKKVIICNDALNVWKEYENYKYKKMGDKITDEVIKLWDDAMDAIRYAVRQITKNGGVGKRFSISFSK